MFEYKLVKFGTSGMLGGKFDTAKAEEQLSLLGKEGWELVSTVSTDEIFGGTKDVILIFKRKK